MIMNFCKKDKLVLDPNTAIKKNLLSQYLANYNHNQAN